MEENMEIMEQVNDILSQEEKEELTAPQEEKAGARQDFVDFFAAHPEIDPRDISQEVLKAVAQGESLELSFTRSENTRLRAELEALRKNEENRHRAAPSTLGSGKKERDPIDEIWDED